MTNFAKGLLAATALITLPSMAQSAVITSNTVIPVPVTTSGLYINVVTGVSGTTPGASPGWDLNPWGTSAVRVWSPTTAGSGIVTTTAGGSVTADLAAGTVISASSFFGTQTGSTYPSGGSHVFGFAFLNEATGIINYGYARFAATAGTTGLPITINQIVYENSGAAITVGGTGAVPEPSTWAMMLVGFGAIGFAARRRTATNTTVRFA